MRTRPLAQIAADVGGTLVGTDAQVRSVVVDSRRARPGSLFFALRGTRTDGHRFVPDAVARGAAAIVANRWVGRADGGSVVKVDDVGRALLELASAERLAFPGTVVGITGSTGKTSTKDMLAAILALRVEVRASPASFNNQVGLPLTILGAHAAAEVIVCEIGGGVVREIAALASVARPDVGVVTNVGLAHVATFGSADAIARAKRELVEHLPPHGIAILNRDDPVVRRFADGTSLHPMTFGRGRGADVGAERIELDEAGRARFALRVGSDRELVELPIPGRHMVWDACAAAAAALALGCSPRDCAAGLTGVRLQPGRMELFRARGGFRVLHDAYNANPESMRAALHASSTMVGPCIAVLGPMRELGAESIAQHRKVGRLVAGLGVERLIVVGDEAHAIADAAAGRGMPESRIRRVADAGTAIDVLRAMAEPRDLVLLKASRAAGFERIAEALR